MPLFLCGLRLMATLSCIFKSYRSVGVLLTSLKTVHLLSPTTLNAHVLVLETAFTWEGLSRHHQGRKMVKFRGWLARRGLQSRRRCIYCLCSLSQACQV